MQERRGSERQRFAEARRDLQAALDRLRGTSGAAVEIAAIRQRLSELSVAELAAADELEVAEAARPADAPSTPLPVQNTLFAFFASTFLAILAVLGREATRTPPQRAARAQPADRSRAARRPALAAVATATAPGGRGVPDARG